MVPEVNLDQVRRELVAEHGIRIEDDDPMLIVFAIAERTMRSVIEAERAKRADENLLTYKDVRHVLMDVRDDAIQTSRDIAAVTVHHTHECVMDKFDDAKIRWFSARYHIRTSIAVLIGTIFGGITTVTLMNLF